MTISSNNQFEDASESRKDIFIFLPDGVSSVEETAKDTEAVAEDAEAAAEDTEAAAEVEG